LVLRPDSDFFRYFGDPKGKSLPGGTNAQAAAPPPGTAPNPPSVSSPTK
jgi:hypothetical protein